MHAWDFSMTEFLAIFEKVKKIEEKVEKTVGVGVCDRAYKIDLIEDRK